MLPTVMLAVLQLAKEGESGSPVRTMMPPSRVDSPRGCAPAAASSLVAMRALTAVQRGQRGPEPVSEWLSVVLLAE